MTQPDQVPLAAADKVRPVERLAPPERWVPDRPAELVGPQHPRGAGLGSPGPDQGYGIKLARSFIGRLSLQVGESDDDAVAGALVVGLRRASLFGRAPVIYDVELAYTLFGFLGVAPADLLAWRLPRFQSLAHHYDAQRALADVVPDETLRLTPAQVAGRLPSWRTMVNAAP